MSFRRPNFSDTLPAAQAQRMVRESRFWELAFTGAILLLLGALWVGYVNQVRTQESRALADGFVRDRTLATFTAHYAERILRNAETVGRYILSAARTDSNRANLTRVMRERLRNNDALHELGLCLGDEVITTALDAGMVSSAHCARLAAQLAAYPGQMAAEPVQNGGKPFVVLALDDGERGEPRALAFCVVAADRLLQLLRDYRNESGLVVSLLSDRRKVLTSWGAAQPDDFLWERSDVLQQQPQNGAVQWQSHADGRDLLLTVLPVTGFSMTVAIASDRALALLDVKTQRIRDLAVAIVITTLSLSILFFLLWLHARARRTAVSLHRARWRLQNLNDSLEHQVRARTSELEQAYRDMEFFSYSVAHDVRAPLAAIQGFARALREMKAPVDPKRAAHYVGRIEANAREMHDLTETLLLLGRASGRELELTSVDVSAIARKVVIGLSERDPRNAANVEVNIADGLRVRADPGLVQPLLENLLGNAWKFSAPRPHPIIQLVADVAPLEPGMVGFVVRDNGPGFAREQAATLFEPFVRGKSTEPVAGYGIGLAIVQRIVRLHGGSIWATSEEGQGAEFHFTLPSSHMV